MIDVGRRCDRHRRADRLVRGEFSFVQRDEQRYTLLIVRPTVLKHGQSLAIKSNLHLAASRDEFGAGCLLSGIMLVVRGSRGGE